MEAYIEIFGPALIVALGLYAGGRRLIQWAFEEARERFNRGETQ
jgi:hypothetical protein